MAGHSVGEGATGLSTEARKRLTIACELVANPAILFLVMTAMQHIAVCSGAMSQDNEWKQRHVGLVQRPSPLSAWPDRPSSAAGDGCRA
jgi:hypothetical protein